MRVTVTEGWVGRKLTELEAASGARAAWLVRFGEAQLPTAGTVLQDGDQLVVAVTDDIVARVHEIVEHGHEAGRTDAGRDRGCRGRRPVHRRRAARPTGTP